MTDMGRHSPPINGIPVANGHTLTPLDIPQLLQVTPSGPVSGWPQTRQEVTAAPDVNPERWRHFRLAVTSHRGWLAAVPVVLVNAVAFGAQLSFWRAHLALPAEAVAVALATESIANYLAWQAHLAQLADDAALRLRLSAYGTALVIGALNYSHYMLRDWRPTVAAVTFGMMSAISPWLWSVHSRRVSRDALKSRGLIEPHAVRLGANRWLWHPVRSWRVMFRATWAGETDPARAIALPPCQVTRKAPAQDAAEPAMEVTPAGSGEVISRPPADVTPEVTPAADVAEPVHVTPEPPSAPDVKSPREATPQPRVTRKASLPRQPGGKAARISDADLKSLVRAEFDADPDVTIAAVAKKLVRSRDRIRPLLEQVRAEAGRPGAASST